MTEEHPTTPTTVYGASKLAAEAHARAFHATHGLPVVVLRPFNAFGPRSHHEGDSGEVIPKFMLRALAGEPLVVFGDGRQTRDFTHVTDIARAIRCAGETDRAIGETFNLGSGREISIGDLARLMARIAGRPDTTLQHAEARPGDVRRLCADAAKAQRSLGFEPRVTLEQGLTELRAWYETQGRTPRDLLTEETLRNWEDAGHKHARGATSLRLNACGTPTIPLARPELGEPEAAAVRRVLASGWVSQGAEVAAFEREFAAAVGAPHACAVASGTAALHLALLAAGVGPGDEVVTVSHSFVATAATVRHCGAMPVFVDIDPATLNLDPSLLDEAIGPRTRAILCAHQLGLPADLASILQSGRRHKLAVVEDAACAVGSEILRQGVWQRIGAPHGEVACFSFHGRKVLTTGEGGMVTTRSSELDREVRALCSHGVTVSAADRHTSRKVVFEQYSVLGYNYRMSDVQAAIGREQLRRLSDLVARRRALAARYAELLSDIGGLQLPAEPAWSRSNWQSYAVRLLPPLKQRCVMEGLLDFGIASRPGVTCAHREGAFPPSSWSCKPSGRSCDCAVGRCRRLAESERAQDEIIQLPLFARMTEDAQQKVADALRRACAP
jgi:dTDP-4-amino-4,6-dideoxygalactose transaminase